jgi:hypothetical protein
MNLGRRDVAAHRTSAPDTRRDWTANCHPGERYRVIIQDASAGSANAGSAGVREKIFREGDIRDVLKPLVDLEHRSGVGLAFAALLRVESRLREERCGLPPIQPEVVQTPELGAIHFPALSFFPVKRMWRCSLPLWMRSPTELSEVPMIEAISL